MKFGVVLLAAGGSTRMGQPKGLLPYRGRTLIEHASQVALDSGASEVVVVLGSEAEHYGERLGSLDVRIVVNPAWTEGMGGSIRVGIAALSDLVEGVVITLGDQPRITSDHLRALAEGLHRAPIVASGYDGVIGAPCAFASSEFERLFRLRGDAGARSLLRSSGEPVVIVAFEGADTDVDTPEAYEKLLASDGDPTK